MRSTPHSGRSSERSSSRGRRQAPTTDLSVPDALSSVVLAVTGLTSSATGQAERLRRTCRVRQLDAVLELLRPARATNLPKFQGQTLPYAVCGYTPSQLRAAYGVGSGGIFDRAAGRRQTVAIVDAYDARRSSGTRTSTRSVTATARSPGASSRIERSRGSHDRGRCGGNGWYGEQALDVEAVHGDGARCERRLLRRGSCYDDDLWPRGPDRLRQQGLDRHELVGRADVLHRSDGGSRDDRPDRDRRVRVVFKQGAVQGIGFFFSSGDDGDEVDNTG